MQGVTARAAVKAKVLKALHAAQVALTKAGGDSHLPVAAAAAAKPITKVAMAALPKIQHAEGDIYEGEDPIDAMKSAISAEMQQPTLTNTGPSAEDPLDQAIDRIAVVRAREKTKRSQKKAKAEGDESSSVLSLLQESEVVAPGAGITGDTGQTIPPSTNAPHGPPNPSVKENTQMVPNKVPLGRSTPSAPSGGADLDQVLASQKGAPSVTGPSSAAPPPPDTKFSKNEINGEMKAIDAYPIARDEAINEAVKQLVPWDRRPDAPLDPKAKGPAVTTASAAPAEPAADNSTNSTNSTMWM